MPRGGHTGINPTFTTKSAISGPRGSDGRMTGTPLQIFALTARPRLGFIFDNKAAIERGSSVDKSRVKSSR
jgi:hypothetical protein